MKFITLHPSVTRCKPEAPLTKLHNDCGRQDSCARRLANTTSGQPSRDYSTTAVPYGTAMLCRWHVTFEAAAAYRDEPEAKTMQAPT